MQLAHYRFVPWDLRLKDIAKVQHGSKFYIDSYFPLGLWKYCLSSGQDGGIGRNPSLPCTTKRRTPTNLKSINNQKHQKIKLHGTLTTKELKKKINQNNQAGKAVDCMGQLRKTVATWQPSEWSWLPSDRLCGRGWRKGKTETQNWLWTMVGVAIVGDTPSLTREFVEKCVRDEQASCTVPSLAPPPQAAKRVALPRWIPKALPPHNISAAPRQRNMAQMKEQSREPRWRRR